MDLAAPVDVAGLGQEAQRLAAGLGGVAVGLVGHGLLDLGPDAGEDLGAGVLDALPLVLGRELRHRRGRPSASIATNTSRHRVVTSRAWVRGSARATVHDFQTWSEGPSGVDDPRLHLDQIADGDRLGEMDVADIGRHAVGAGPADGAGIARLVDPFQYLAAPDIAADVGVHRRRQEAQGDAALLAGHVSAVPAPGW